MVFSRKLYGNRKICHREPRVLSPGRGDLIPGLEIATGSKNRCPRNDISFLEKTELQDQTPPQNVRFNDKILLNRQTCPARGIIRLEVSHDC